MMVRLLLLAGLAQIAALAQLQVLLFDGAKETAVGSLVDVGTASPGDTITTRFRVRNLGSGPAVLSSLSLAGSGFLFSSTPSLPYTIAPYTGSPVSEAEFSVAFNPTDVADYSAFLAVNTVNVILEGSGTPSAILTLSGSNTPLIAGAIVDFGSLASGQTESLTFVLTNPGNSAITVGALSVSGSGFRGPIGAAAGITLQPNQPVAFQVEFQPTSGQASQGSLVVDQRSFVLTGQGLNPPLPAASIVFGSTAGESAQQDTITIALAAASQVSGLGTLTLTFQSSVPGTSDDAAIQFLSGPTRHATVTIGVGDTTAKFDAGQPDLAFQTGTTAGKITFVLTWNASSTAAAQNSLTISPSAVNIQTATSIRQLGAVDVSITGFDNTYTAAGLAFTFYDKNGNALPPGTIQLDAGSNFKSYFAATQTGGSFGLLATFRVSGDTSLIAGAQVQITNSAGATSTQKITVGN